MGMRAAVPGTLDKRSVLVFFVIDAVPRERSYLFWQQVPVIRNLYPFLFASS